jgi:hypothetical protein
MGCLYNDIDLWSVKKIKNKNSFFEAMATVLDECFYCSFVTSLYKECEICGMIACEDCAVSNEWEITSTGDITRCFEHPEGFIEMKDVEETEL